MVLQTRTFMLGIILIVAGCDVPSAGPAAEETAAASTVPSGDVDGMKAVIKAEPKVIDFVYDPSSIYQWVIGVKDDGTPRYGYAEYFCSLLKDKGFTLADNKVRIVDYYKFTQKGGTARNASLGSVDCGTFEHSMP